MAERQKTDLLRGVFSTRSRRRCLVFRTGQRPICRAGGDRAQARGGLLKGGAHSGRLRRLSAARLAEAGVEPPVGSIGDSYDNALAETINGLYKAEVIHRRGPWRSFEAVEFATLEWVDRFNNRRLLEPIGNIPPAEAEQRYYAMLSEPAVAA